MFRFDVEPIPPPEVDIEDLDPDKYPSLSDLLMVKELSNVHRIMAFDAANCSIAKLPGA